MYFYIDFLNASEHWCTVWPNRATAGDWRQSHINHLYFVMYKICISYLQKSYFCELWLALWPSRNTADSERLTLEEADKPLSSAKPSVRKELGQPTFQQGYKWEREVQIQIQIQLQIREIDKPLSSFHQPNGLSAKKLMSPFFHEDTNGKDNGKRIWTCHNTGCKQHKSNCLFKEKVINAELSKCPKERVKGRNKASKANKCSKKMGNYISVAVRNPFIRGNDKKKFEIFTFCF